MKTIYVTATWRSIHEIEVPDDWEDDGSLSFTEYEDITSQIAELTDWEVRS